MDGIDIVFDDANITRAGEDFVYLNHDRTLTDHRKAFEYVVFEINRSTR